MGKKVYMETKMVRPMSVLTASYHDTSDAQKNLLLQGNG